MTSTGVLRSWYAFVGLARNGQDGRYRCRARTIPRQFDHIVRLLGRIPETKDLPERHLFEWHAHGPLRQAFLVCSLGVTDE